MKKIRKHWILSFLLIAAMMVTSLAILSSQTVDAATDLRYYYRYWDNSSKTVKSEWRWTDNYSLVSSLPYNGGNGRTLNSGWWKLDLTDVNDPLIIKGTVNDNKSETAAIGGGNETSTSTINIYGGTITANGAKYGAGIGGGNEGKSGTIIINDGTVNAKGVRSGAGIGASYLHSLPDDEMDDPTVEITIKGGTINATGYDGADKYTDNIASPGIGIGAFAGRSLFNGYIKITGGTVVSRAGKTMEEYIDKAVAIGAYGNKGNGTIEISGGTIDAYTGGYQYGYYETQMTYESPAFGASSITIKDSKDKHLAVSTIEKPEKFVSADKRQATLTQKGKGVHIEICTHGGDSSYTDITDTTHTKECSYCGQSVSEDHNFGEPVWTWNEDYTKASVTLVCSDCEKEVSAEATITDSTSEGITTYTAVATINGTEYTDTKTVENTENNEDAGDSENVDASQTGTSFTGGSTPLIPGIFALLIAATAAGVYTKKRRG